MASIQLLGFAEAQAALRRLGQERMNIAIAAGLNRTSLAVERAQKISMARDLDRPTPFTLNAVKRYKADRNRLQTTVFVQPIQAKYLKNLVTGGTLPTILTPINVTLNQYGNIRGKSGGMDRIKGSSRKKFIATINGVTGVWQRYGPKGRRLKLLVMVKRDARREQQWDFYGIAERVVQQRLRNDIAATIREELARL